MLATNACLAGPFRVWSRETRSRETRSRETRSLWGSGMFNTDTVTLNKESRLTCFLRRGAWLVVMRLRGKHSLVANLPGVRDAALLDLLLLAGRHLLRVLLGKLVWEESYKYAYSWREGLG